MGQSGTAALFAPSLQSLPFTCSGKFPANTAQLDQ